MFHFVAFNPIGCDVAMARINCGEWLVGQRFYLHFVLLAEKGEARRNLFTRSLVLVC